MQYIERALHPGLIARDYQAMSECRHLLTPEFGHRTARQYDSRVPATMASAENLDARVRERRPASARRAGLINRSSISLAKASAFSGSRFRVMTCRWLAIRCLPAPPS